MLASGVVREKYSSCVSRVWLGRSVVGCLFIYLFISTPVAAVFLISDQDSFYNTPVF